MIKILLAILTIPFVLSGLIWGGSYLPDIPVEITQFIAGITVQLWVLNEFVALDTFATYALYVITIETIIFVVRLLDGLRTSVTGAAPLFTFGRFGKAPESKFIEYD